MNKTLTHVNKFATCDPISVAHPTQMELQQSKLLVNFIESKDPPSTPEEDKLKKNILERLSAMVQAWVRAVGDKKVSIYLVCRFKYFINNKNLGTLVRTAKR